MPGRVRILMEYETLQTYVNFLTTIRKLYPHQPQELRVLIVSLLC
jgi:hypothetical protein